MGRIQVDKQKQAEVIRLYDVGIETTASIECTKCDANDHSPYDAEEAAEDFYDNGWRVNKDGMVICPKHRRI